MRALVTGANRGIGLEIARLLSARGDSVVGACRNPRDAAELASLPGATLVRLDVADEASIESLLAQLGDAPVDLLINNAGALDSSPGFAERRPQLRQLGQLRAGPLLEMLMVNSVGPLLVAQAVADRLEAGAKIVNISSQIGSLTNKRSGGTYGYAASKAALNMFTRALAGDLGPRGVTVACVHPGWVSTRMGGPNAPMTVEESARRIVQICDSLTPADNGRFLTVDTFGDHPW